MIHRTLRNRGRKRAVVGLAVALAISITATACGSSGSSGAGGLSKLTVGEIFPFTGAKAQLSSWGTHGVDTGIFEVNQHGGVMGHQLETASVDDAADPVDALPALRKLLLKNPSVVIGPFSPTIMAVINNFDPNHVVDFVIGGTTQLDNMNHPYVFRTTASDSTETVAMAYYAAKKGYTKASLIFDNSANTQGFVAPLTKAFQKLGGTISANLSIVPGQSSYRSELIQAFASHPQVIFAAFDTQTASTLWSNARQLGYLNTPWVGDDQMSGAAYAKAFGSGAETNLFSAVGAPPGGPSYKHFQQDYNAVFHTDKPLPATQTMYDAVLISALAMTQAKSTDPKVWVDHVVDVSSPPGTACTDYATCVGLLNAGKTINYEGASGAVDFNSHHNVFNGYSIVGFTPALTSREVSYVTKDQVAQNAG